MVGDHQTHRETSDERVDAPRFRDHEGHADHAGGDGEAKEEGVLELLDDVAGGLPKGDVVEFLAGGAPLHIDAEEVAEERLRYVQRHATKEDGQHWDPFQVGPESVNEA